MVNTTDRRKILLVDDIEMHLITAELFLKAEYEIYKAKSGQEALDLLIGNKLVPDIIMLDIVMPNMNGWEVFKRIKAIDFLNKVPIVFLTSEDEEAEKEKAYKMGIADYITKPYNMTDLIGRIKNVIKKSEKIAALRKGTKYQNRKQSFPGFYDTGRLYKEGRYDQQ
jgi:DNA-binding response OmpR family regulator